MHPIRIVAAMLTVAILYMAAVGFLLSQPAHGHTAASGWQYDPACCSTQDCAPIRVELVEITAQGYRVTVRPGDHPLVDVPTTYVFPFNSPKVRFSGDQHYHLCVGHKSKAGLCLYIPGTGA